MNLKRRTFIGQASIGALALTAAKPVRVAASFINVPENNAQNGQLTICHTNDLNGNIRSLTGGAGLKQIKLSLLKEQIHGLLLDGGNFLHHANSAKQHLQMIALMNTMGYLAATPGENELASGQEAFARLIPSMNFNLVNCNYSFDSALSGKIHPYIIKQNGGVRIGITAVGPQLKGVGFSDPIQSANAVAEKLKTVEKCDLVICLSHLGFSDDELTADSRELARSSRHIDFIISGNHSDAVVSRVIVLNKNKHEVFVNQAAPYGAMFGKIRLGFGADNQKKSLHIKNVNLA